MKAQTTAAPARATRTATITREERDALCQLHDTLVLDHVDRTYVGSREYAQLEALRAVIRSWDEA